MTNTALSRRPQRRSIRRQRDAFLKALAEELERHPVVGPGLVHRCAADLQRRFVVEAHSETRRSRDISGRTRRAAERAEAPNRKLDAGGRDASNAVPTTLTLARPDASPVTMRSCRAWFL